MAGAAADRMRGAGLAVVFVCFAIGGLAHVVFTAAEMRIVPPWMPWLRLPLQAALLMLIAWAVIRRAPPPAGAATPTPSVSAR